MWYIFFVCSGSYNMLIGVGRFDFRLGGRQKEWQHTFYDKHMMVHNIYHLLIIAYWHSTS